MNGTIYKVPYYCMFITRNFQIVHYFCININCSNQITNVGLIFVATCSPRSTFLQNSLCTFFFVYFTQLCHPNILESSTLTSPFANNVLSIFNDLDDFFFCKLNLHSPIGLTEGCKTDMFRFVVGELGDEELACF